MLNDLTPDHRQANKKSATPGLHTLMQPSLKNPASTALKLMELPDQCSHEGTNQRAYPSLSSLPIRPQLQSTQQHESTKSQRWRRDDWVCRDFVQCLGSSNASGQPQPETGHEAESAQGCTQPAVPVHPYGDLNTSAIQQRNCYPLSC